MKRSCLQIEKSVKKNRLLAAASTSGEAIPGVPATDTLKEVTPAGFVTRTLDRSRIVAVQTPQVFRKSLLDQAFRQLGSRSRDFSDCSGLIEHCGARVRVVEGNQRNMKVTTQVDLALARALLAGGAAAEGSL